jgi:hypothetical protein
MGSRRDDANHCRNNCTHSHLICHMPSLSHVPAPRHILGTTAGMWFAQKFSSPDSIFNLAESIEIHGPIDPLLFEAALRQAGSEAETVRIRFIEQSDGPRQLISRRLNTAFAGASLGRERRLRVGLVWQFASCSPRGDLRSRTRVNPTWYSFC